MSSTMKKTIACACIMLACMGSSINAQDPISASAVTLGQVASSPSSVSSAPPTTYLVYVTVNGVQTSEYHTFIASTPTPSTTVAPAAGTVLAYSSYIPPASSTSGSTGAAAPGASKFSKTNGQVAAMGVLLSMLVGAIAVW